MCIFSIFLRLLTLFLVKNSELIAFIGLREAPFKGLTLKIKKERGWFFYSLLLSKSVRKCFMPAN